MPAAMLWKFKCLLIFLVCAVILHLCVLSFKFPVGIYGLIGGKDYAAWESTPLKRAKFLAAYLKEREERVVEADCSKLFQGDKAELAMARALEKQSYRLPSDEEILKMAGDCARFVQYHGFLLDPLTKLEAEFPLAFSVLAYKRASQVVGLLRAIYRPQNWYCLHADRKSPRNFRLALQAVSRCFPNVFMASHDTKVNWGFFSVLEPELVCMGDLWKRKAWKYFIKLTGQEFPLKTNYELVRILQAFKGANSVEGSVADQRTIGKRWARFLPAPHNITVYKGGVQVVVSRAFVDYALHSPKAQTFLEWCKQTRHPDEHFFNSLNYNSHLRVPGGGKGAIAKPGRRQYTFSASVARYTHWRHTSPCPNHTIIRGICIMNALDLPLLRKQKYLFANKFYDQGSRVALRCLAEDLHNRTTEQTLGYSAFNVSYYEQLDFVRNRLW